MWTEDYITKNMQELRSNILREMINNKGTITVDKIINIIMSKREPLNLKSIYRNGDNNYVEQVKSIEGTLVSLLREKFEKDVKEQIPMLMNIEYVQENGKDVYTFNATDFNNENKLVKVPDVITGPYEELTNHEIKKRELKLYSKMDLLVPEDINIILESLEY